MALIADLSINLSANISKFSQSLKAAGTKVNDFKTSVMAAGKSAGSALSSGLMAGVSAATVGIAALAAGAVAAVGALGALAYSQFPVIDNLADTADKLGMSTEALAGMRHAAEVAGTPVAQLDASLAKLRVNIGKAVNGGGEAAKALQTLGLSAADLGKMTTEQQFSAIADALNTVSNKTQQATLATQIFGEAGQSLLLTTKLGSEGLKEYQKEAERLGLTLSRESAEAVGQAGDAIDRMKKSIQGVGIQLAPILAPAIQHVADILTGTIVQIRQWAEQWKPHLMQIANIWNATWTAALQMFSAIWQQIAAIFSPIVSWLAEKMGFAGTTFEDFKTTVLQALIAIEFYIANWQRVWELAVATAAHGLVSFAADVGNIFTSVIPQVFISFGQFTGTFFTNLWSNVVNGLKAIWAKLKGEDASFVWQPLSEGFEKAMKDIDKSFERPETALEKVLREDMERQQAALTGDLSKFMDQRMQELTQAGEGVGKAVEGSLPDFEDLGIDEIEVNGKIQGPNAVERGSQQAFDIIANAQNQKGNAQEKMARDNLNENKRTNDILGDLKKLIEDNGLLAADLA